MKYTTLFTLLILTLFGVENFAQSECDCSDIEFTGLTNLDTEDCCGERRWYNLQDDCIAEIWVDGITYNATNNIFAVSVTSCNTESKNWRVSINGVICFEGTVECEEDPDPDPDPCDEPQACNFSLNLDENICELAVCRGSQWCFGSSQSFTLTKPDGTILNWVMGINTANFCETFQLDQNGEYCITMQAQDGCIQTECITVECVPCDPENPKWLETEVFYPQLSWYCYGPDLVLIPMLGLGPVCDDCCENVPPSQKYIKYSIDWLVLNKSNNNAILYSETTTYQPSDCGGVLNSPSGQIIIPCASVDNGDEIELTWIVTVVDTEGCEYFGNNPFGGAFTDVVNIIGNCCD